ncbi:response regulator [Vibrio navarrensis]|uniref:Chemotaxis protein CheY n=1 Tax=Vibrio navarrensis TaxID=29495 RepID=A0A099LW89_9VIBR|nr:response regulator [Vibrio navarrensis]EHA1123517.1 response regulator [Vibrio navarrensis]ELN6934153.1 response regulator [Vibrio navarrensis]KGK11557.1 chemotaxis protein CheY [Vibrio navarrensis]KGK20901.1 chemotaxis protein CheY [Vibrio navarrensis]MBE3666515.1 DNA-binding response regulator [Vibrio navarrensis]
MAENPKLIIVEDDIKLQQMLGDYFQSQGFTVITTDNGLDAPSLILQEKPCIVLLDLMLPGQDGLSVCRQIRDSYFGKILMLTASDDDFDHVAALEMGADDYVNKPIKPRVLLARIRMLLRRPDVTVHEESNHCQFGVLKLNRIRKECQIAGRVVSLTDGEFDLLWLLASSAEQVLSREWLTKTLRGIEYDGVDRTIDNRIVTLRKKLDDTTPARKILTVRGKGYMFMPDVWE